MIIDLFKDYRGFPFKEYYKDAIQYAASQKYWLYVLRNSQGFEERDWDTMLNSNVERHLTDGLMLCSRNKSFPKEILIYTRSFEGAVNEVHKDNSGMSAEDVRSARELFHYDPPEAEVRGFTWDEAKEVAGSFYEDFVPGVDEEMLFKNDPTHPEEGGYRFPGGVYLFPGERLTIVSEIKKRAVRKKLFKPSNYFWSLVLPRSE